MPVKLAQEFSLVDIANIDPRLGTRWLLGIFILHGGRNVLVKFLGGLLIQRVRCSWLEYHGSGRVVSVWHSLGYPPVRGMRRMGGVWFLTEQHLNGASCELIEQISRSHSIQAAPLDSRVPFASDAKPKAWDFRDQGASRLGTH